MSSSGNEKNSISNDRVTVTAGDVPLTPIASSRPPDNTNRETDSGRNNTAFVEIASNDNKDAADTILIPPFLPGVDILSSTDLEIPAEFNTYRNRKTLTQGLMDIALFSANANQLRYILEHGATNQAYFYIATSLIIISLILQIVVGLLLLLSTQYNVGVECQRKMAFKNGNYTVMGIFLITVVNIFIAAFGGPAVAK